MEGPAFSTRAESLMHRLWGGDLIGMTAMPEAKLAREAEMPYALVALVTDYDCWQQKPAVPPPVAAVPPGQESARGGRGRPRGAAAGDHRQPRSRLGQRDGADPGGFATHRRRPGRVAGCPASSALKLAIWSDKTRVAEEEVRKLEPLWGKYFVERTKG